MKKAIVIPAVALAGLMAATGLAGCDTGSKAPEGFTAISYYATYVKAEAKAAYNELIETYNNGQGKEDKVYVEMTPNPGAVNNLKSILTKKKSSYDVVSMTNMQFKTLAMEEGNGDGIFLALDDYLTDSAKARLDWEQISPSQINVWRFNLEKDASIGGKHLAGAGAKLLGLPFNSGAQVLIYNADIFREMGLNIVSVEEAKCGVGDYAKLLPHGYAEYAESYGAPFAGATLSENDLGEKVYKVFNNRVPMNWEELRCLARSYQKDHSGKYGYMSEWWFNYGWSVGGDCIGWNSETNSYDFAIGDKDKNYLALSDITVNGTSYAQGEVLDYEDMKYLRANAQAYSALSADLYELPSMYEAFLEFNRLGVPADKEVEDGVKGYGVAKSTTKDRTKEFTSGESPMVCEEASDIHVLYGGIAGKFEFDFAPLAQYREYEGGSTREVGGKEYLKVVDDSWTGELKTTKNSKGESVACVGEAITCISNESSALAIARNIDESKYQAAFDFISWACGPEGQAILAKGNTCIPNQANLSMSEEFNSSSDRLIKNQWAAGFAFHNSSVGDWSYFNVDTWITNWSTPLNSDVRAGNLKLTDFLNQYTATATTALSTMKIRIKGK